MKHIFVVNPCAGGKDSSDTIALLLSTSNVTDYELYHTTAPRDATRFVKHYCTLHPDEALRFYACGGDGTLNEVVSGVMQAPQPTKKGAYEVGCYPCGSGNDYIKCWLDSDFTDINALIAGTSVPVDVMRLADRYSINVLNIGFEAEVCRTMHELRRVPIIGGRMAYTSSIVHSLARGRKNRCRITVDDCLWHDGEILLSSLANGRYVGGGYLCAPRSLFDDGLLEVMSIKPLSIARFANLIKYYERGEHLDRPEMRDIVSYSRGSKVTLESDSPFFIAIDGELVEDTRFDIENMHQAIRFITPANIH